MMSKMSGKGRSSSNSDVSGARTKLDGVLQDLVEKAEESIVAEEQLATRLEDGTIIKQEPEDDYPSVPEPQPKKVTKSRKRRKRELPSSQIDHDLVDGTKLQHSYIMKLFDRSVDLAQFRSNSSLYPVCREWLHNDPSAGKSRATQPERSPSPDPLQDTEQDEENPIPNIHRLPPPSDLASEICEEGGDLRIPSPVPQPTEELDIHVDASQAPSKEIMLKNHLDRWRGCRQKWKDAAQTNQARYTESYVLLKAMYDSDRQ